MKMLAYLEKIAKLDDRFTYFCYLLDLLASVSLMASTIYPAVQPGQTPIETAYTLATGSAYAICDITLLVIGANRKLWGARAKVVLGFICVQAVVVAGDLGASLWLGYVWRENIAWFFEEAIMVAVCVRRYLSLKYTEELV